MNCRIFGQGKAGTGKGQDGEKPKAGTGKGRDGKSRGKAGPGTGKGRTGKSQEVLEGPWRSLEACGISDFPEMS